VVLGILVVAVRVSSLPAPLLYRAIIDDALGRQDGALLAWLIGGLAAVLVVSRILGFFLQNASARVQQAVLHDIRLAIYQHLQKLDMGFYRKHPTGGLLSRIMSDVSQVQAILSRETFEIAAASLQVIVVGGLLLWLNPRLSLVAALVFPILVVLVALFQKRLYRISKAMQERRETLSAKIQENLAGNRLVQALALEPQRLEVTRDTSGRLRDTIVRSEVIGSSVNLLTIGLTEIPLTLLVWGYGGYLVLSGAMSLGSLLAFYQYLMAMYEPVIRIFRFNIQLQVARAAVDRIYEVLDTQPAVADPPNAPPITIREGKIRFENVSFRYDTEGPYAIRDLDLELPAGQVLGLVGPSGAGKSTLVHGLLRFLAPTSGRIVIDGQDTADVSMRSLRKKVGYVPQEVFLFSDTLRANIALACPEAPIEDIRKAAEAAQAHVFIDELPTGYESEVGEGGLGLSGGERQRIALARAILQDPPILVFDEATSSLDATSEALIQKALEKFVRGRTTIIIAHRLSTLKLCDRIAVMSHGRLVQVGNHEELSAMDGLYRGLLQAQLLQPPPALNSVPPPREPG
jgi:subfamily B ATP-binding cassette protein MsbA